VAGLGRRLVARLIDAVLVLAVVVLLAVLLFGAALSGVRTDANGAVTSGGGGFFAAYLGWSVLGLLLSLLYEVGLVATRGATLGKQMMHLRVVREADGALPGWTPAALRWLVQATGFVTCGLATVLVYLSPLLDGTGRQQGWHDKVAGTQVVST
jgi:uncharacterized RDD family membrane protein YckC